MRRRDKEINDSEKIIEIIKQSKVCRLALADNNIPYIVPLSFAFEDQTLYFHSAREGQKIDTLKKNKNVCFEFESELVLVKKESFCNWGMNYSTVIGRGTARFVENAQEKMRILNLIVNQYSEKPILEPIMWSEKTIHAIVVFAVDILSMTGKKSGE